MTKPLLLIALFLLTLNTYGQVNLIKFGIKGGLNYSNFADNNNDDIPADYTGKIGFHLGGFVKFGISEKISIRPELLYSQQGSNFTINGSDLNITNPEPVFITSIKGEIKESLLLLPVIIIYTLSDKLHLECGPQFGYSLNRKIDYDNNPFNFGGFLKNEKEEKFELGLSLGFGYYLSDDLGISLRYNYGIIERQNLNTSVFQLGMNYQL
ncbi:porin family protein [Tenacibaculum tangerinum]|uniref:Porin family protein n=1 Tax=Tenacibaculum tangerinum TaxID=3038772 RepID=A0ABY8L7A8_9FLAO|nr:porin family protein [Tenacibaculum tangerinum]WGH75974.1 porin family protein [Tenacibaculum tangerinum]